MKRNRQKILVRVRWGFAWGVALTVVCLKGYAADLLSFQALAQDSLRIEVKGVTKDFAGVLPNVTVTLKGNPKVGTASDQNGRFILMVPSSASILEFKMVGYETQEIVVGSNADLNVVMKPAASDLDE